MWKTHGGILSVSLSENSMNKTNLKTKKCLCSNSPCVIIKLSAKQGIFLHHHVDASHLHHHLSYRAGTAKTKQNKNVVNNWASVWVNCPKSWISTPAACSESRENEILIPLRPPNSTVATCWSPSSDMTALKGARVGGNGLYCSRFVS